MRSDAGRAGGDAPCTANRTVLQPACQRRARHMRRGIASCRGAAGAPLFHPCIPRRAARIRRSRRRRVSTRRKCEKRHTTMIFSRRNDACARRFARGKAASTSFPSCFSGVSRAMRTRVTPARYAHRNAMRRRSLPDDEMNVQRNKTPDVLADTRECPAFFIEYADR